MFVITTYLCVGFLLLSVSLRLSYFCLYQSPVRIRRGSKH